MTLPIHASVHMLKLNKPMPNHYRFMQLEEPKTFKCTQGYAPILCKYIIYRQFYSVLSSFQLKLTVG